MHDFTIWPTKPLQEQGWDNELGLSAILDDEYLGNNPDRLISMEQAQSMDLQAIEGGQWAPVLATETGGFISTSVEELGWSLD